MTSLKCWNSGVTLKGSALILSPLGCGASFRVPAVSEEEVASSILQVLAGKFLVSNPASNNLFHDASKAFRIRKVPGVVAESLFVNVTEEMERLDADVGSMQATLQEAPEVLHRVGVDVSIDVLDCVVNEGVLIVGCKAVIGFQFIAEYRGASFDAFADQRLKVFLLASVNMPCYDFSATLHHSKDNFFTLRPASGNLLVTLRFVHIPSLATDESLVYFNFATEFVEPSFLHGKTDAMVHKPSSLLSDFQSAMEFIGTDSILATDEEPRGAEPLLKGNRGILKNRSSLQREGGSLMARVALPYALFGEPRDLIGAALRAFHNTIRPAQFHHELVAVLEIREPDNCVSEGVWRFHISSMRQNSRNVKYVIALGSGFIWRSFHNVRGAPIACVKDIRPGDDLLLGYRSGGGVNLLARFRVGRPDEPIKASPVFGEIPAVWVEEFRRHGYHADPKLGALVGIFVEEGEPLTGRIPYAKQNALSRLRSEAPDPVTVVRTCPVPTSAPRSSPASPTRPQPEGPKQVPQTREVRDGVHVGIDVGGRQEKGFDLCITEWINGQLSEVQWKRLPHAAPLPPTSDLRALVCGGDLDGFASMTHASASATSVALWKVIQQVGASGVHIDAPSAFSRNRLGHGRLCEKGSFTGVSLQSTPSIACGREHGGDWGWLVYGMGAFGACLHRGQLTVAQWLEDLKSGTFARWNLSGLLLRECFPTATISVLRAFGREADVERSLLSKSNQPEVQAVLEYLGRGVKGVKCPGHALYDRADALVAALGGLPHVDRSFRELPPWAAPEGRWIGNSGDERIEGLFTCVK